MTESHDASTTCKAQNLDDSLLSSYDYELNEESIAKYPLSPKQNARLLVYDKGKDSITHASFRDFFAFIDDDYLIVLNNTKVLKARIFGRKTSGAKIEILFHHFLHLNQCLVQIKGRVKENDIIECGEHVRVKIIALCDNGLRIVEFYHRDSIMEKSELFDMLDKIGNVPLPPYINREAQKSDIRDYQSVFATHLGAIAAPTASLHFDENDLERIKKRNHCFITLHVGAGTFFGVESHNIYHHKMHEEEFFISQNAQSSIDNASKILCVGTTACRGVEFYARSKKTSGMCDIFINPKNPPIKTNALLTNFHLPKSTLLMLVAGFIGLEKTKHIYEIAKNHGYRFYSYGDGMLII